MVNPLHLLNFRPRPVTLRERRRVRLPSEVSTTDAVFVVLRRMRSPIIFVIVAFSFCTAGMMLMPGVDAAGRPSRLTLFDAFYQMTITLTTVGYSEVPYSFSYAQRMWLTLSIFVLVVAWAYAIGGLFSAVSEPAFREALHTQRFRRRVRALREPFYLLLGYGHAGRIVAREFDNRRIRFVVVDQDQARVDAAANDPLGADVPALAADCTDPAVLTIAGLGHPQCAGVLALTDDDTTNLAASMTVALLRPEQPLLARCDDADVQRRIEEFGPQAVINPSDRFGGYLALAALNPVVYQLLTWLMENDQPTLADPPEGLATGRWVVAGDGNFADETVSDLTRAGLDVHRIAGDASAPLDLADAVAFVASTDDDLANIFLSEQARTDCPGIFVAVRNVDARHRPLLRALDVDVTFVPTEIVAREALARIVTPNFWQFVEATVEQDESTAASLRDRLVERCGRATPELDMITLSDRDAPAVARWLRTQPLVTGDLLRHPDMREQPVSAAILALVRDGNLTFAPGDDVELQVEDSLLLAGASAGLTDISDALFSAAAIEYVVTGRHVPNTWIWRTLGQRHSTAASAQ